MRSVFAARVLIALTLVSASAPVSAQIMADDVIDPGERSEAVEGALRWQQIDSEVTYLGPTAEFDPSESLEIEVPEPEPTPEELSTASRWSSGIVVGLILAVIVLLFVLFGNRLTVSFGKTGEGGRRIANEKRGGDAPQQTLPVDGLLEHLAAMADRREALILLTGRALERAASMNGLTLARAQTARDVVRSLPRHWTHIDAIRRLVREAEVVHFGGRDLAEETWQACLAAARPLFSDAGRA